MTDTRVGQAVVNLTVITSAGETYAGQASIAAGVRSSADQTKISQASATLGIKSFTNVMAKNAQTVVTVGVLFGKVKIQIFPFKIGIRPCFPMYGAK